MGKGKLRMAIKKVGGALLGIGGQQQANKFNKKQATKAFKRQKKLNAKEYERQRSLNVQGQKLGMQTWNDTNYGAQMEHMRKAGLNPGLMYGMSGGGGQTTSTPSGGSVSGGSAPQGAPMGIEGINQAALIASQVELNKSQAKKNIVEAEKTATVDTVKTTQDTKVGKQAVASAIQGMKESQAKTKLIEIEGRIATAKRDEELKILAAEARQAIVKADIDEAMEDTVMRQMAAELIGQSLKNKLTGSEIDMNDAQIAKMAEDIAQGWEDLDRKDWEAEMKVAYPNVMNVAGNIWEEFRIILESIIGGVPMQRRRR